MHFAQQLLMGEAVRYLVAAPLPSGLEKSAETISARARDSRTE